MNGMEMNFFQKGFRSLSLSCDNVKPHSFSNETRGVMGIGKKLSFESWSGVFAKDVVLIHGKGRGKCLRPVGIVVQYCFFLFDSNSRITCTV